ncbi:MAG: DUF5666 domain-containing protein [Dehalococcoidia bacterium]
MDETQDDQTIEGAVDRAVERLLNGEPLDAILASHPEQAATLAPLLQSADLLLSAPAFDAAPAQRTQAMRRMLDQVEASAVGTGGGGGIMSIFNSFRGRPLAFQGIAVAAALVLFGALGLGASAATGNAPEPVREFLGIASDSTIRVELEGTIVTVEPSTSTLTISANGDIRTVIVTGSTELSRGGDPIALSDFVAGQRVEVKGSLQPDNSIVATRVHLEDGDDDERFPTVAPSMPGADAPTAAPTDDRDDDDDDDDNSGPGNADDDDGDHFDDDNSGPGNGDDDDDDGDNDDRDDGDDRDRDDGNGGDDDNDDD